MNAVSVGAPSASGEACQRYDQLPQSLVMSSSPVWSLTVHTAQDLNPSPSVSNEYVVAAAFADFRTSLGISRVIDTSTDVLVVMDVITACAPREPCCRFCSR